MYQVGELIVYGNVGVCRVKDVKQLAPSKAGETQPYYVLEPLFQSCTISTPVGNRKVFMRPVISRSEAERLIDMIPSLQTTEYHSPVSRELREHYEASIKNYDCRELMELTMSIYAKKQTREQTKKKIGVVDERFMRRAEELLFGELAVALEIPREGVQEYIAARVEAQSQRKHGARSAEA